MSASAESTESSSVSPFQIITTIGVLKPFIEEALTIVDEAKIFVDENSLEIREADPANVGMVDVSLDTNIFEQYNGESHQDLVLGIDFKQFDQILNQGNYDDKVRLLLDPETKKLTVTINDSLDFTMGLLDPDSIRTSPDLPDLDLKGRAEIHGSEFNRAVRAADMVSDHVEIGISSPEEEFFFYSEGDTDDMCLELSDGDEGIEAISGGDDELSSLYSLEYLKDFKANVKGEDNLSLRLGNDFPAKINVEKADNESLDVTYMLAPRIEA